MADSRTKPDAEIERTVKKTYSRAITEIERRALDLLVAGASYDQIGTILGFSRTSAFNTIAKAMAKRADEFRASHTYERAVVLHLDRLDRLFAKWLPLALGSGGIPPSDKAAEIVLKVMERQDKILGLSAPQKVEQTTTVVVTTEQLESRRTALLDGLAEVEQRRRQIEGEFRETPTEPEAA